MQKDALLGIDIGSTTIRCCVFDTMARMIKQVSRPARLYYIPNDDPVDTTIAWDAELMWDLLLEILQEVGSFLSSEKLFPLGVAISSVGCSPIIIDALGNPIYPIYRHFPFSSKLLHEFQEKMGEPGFRDITGYPLSYTSTGFVLSALLESDATRFRQANRIIPVSSYLAYRLTGQITSDLSLAGSFGFWDHRRQSWWGEFLSRLGLQEENLGVIVNGGDFIGLISRDISEQTGLRSNLPVYAGGHDYICAALAAGCFQPGHLFNIEGTFDIVANFQHAPVALSHSDPTRVISDIHVVPNTFSLMIERIGAGQVEWVKNLLYPVSDKSDLSSDWDAINRELEMLNDSRVGPEIIIPHIYGMQFPISVDWAWGGVLGLHSDSTRASIMRSALLSSCFESRRMVEYQLSLNKAGINTITVVGGATRNRYWMQQKANIIGMEIQVPHVEEASSLGAALLAGLGAGVFSDFNQVFALTSSIGRTIYQPEASKHELYSGYYHDVYLPVIRQVETIDRIIVKSL